MTTTGWNAMSDSEKNESLALAEIVGDMFDDKMPGKISTFFLMARHEIGRPLTKRYIQLHRKAAYNAYTTSEKFAVLSRNSAQLNG